MIDLNKIIARKSYQVNMPPDEVFKEIEKFLNPKELYPGCKIWDIELEGLKFKKFSLNFVCSFIARNLTRPYTMDKIKKIEEEYYKNHRNNMENIIITTRGNIPYELNVIISNVNELGCKCITECRTLLYLKLSKHIISENNISDIEIQDASIAGLNFLDQVFIGGLEAKPIQKVDLKSFRFKLLINDTNIREITEKIDLLLNEATGEVLMCGWIGTHYIPKFKELMHKGINIRFITHKPQEARNLPWKSDIEKAYEELCSEIGLENICIDPSIHGRMIIVDNKALVGSMDLSSYSLTGAHTEFAIYTEEPEIVRRLRRQFNVKFKPLKAS